MQILLVINCAIDSLMSCGITILDTHSQYLHKSKKRFLMLHFSKFMPAGGPVYPIESPILPSCVDTHANSQKYLAIYKVPTNLCILWVIYSV